MTLRITACGWFLGAGALYTATAARTVIWADSSKLTIYALFNYFPSVNPGDHPGWTIAARVWLWLTPWWAPVRSLHLFSAFCGAAAVAALFLLIERRTGCREAAHTAAAVMLVAHPHWWSSTVTESYTLAVLLTLLALLAAGQRQPRPVLTGILAALSVSCHAFSLLLLVGALVGQRRRWKPLAVGIGLGSAPLWLALILGVPPDPLTGFTAGGASSWIWHLQTFLEPGSLARGFGTVFLLVSYGIGPTGLLALLRTPYRLSPGNRIERFLDLAGLGALAVLLMTYSAFRLHLMVTFALLGLVLLFPPRLPGLWRSVHLAFQFSVYLLVPAVVAHFGWADLGVRQLHGRNNADYFLRPVRTWDTAADQYGRALLECVPDGGAVLADFNPGAVLKILQIANGVRADVLVVPTAVDGALASGDPAAHLASSIRDLRISGREVVLADSWPPYYRTEELQNRFAYSFHSCGPGLLILDTGRPQGVGGAHVEGPAGLGPETR